MTTIVGTGNFGTVKICKDIKTGTTYAMKMLLKSEIIRLKQIDHMRNELTILTEVEHPFIVKFFGFTQDCQYLYYLLEFIPGGELFSLLRDETKFPVEKAAFYSAQIVSTFEYLHSKGIVFRDLKPENILIGTDGYLKLTDFGFAKRLAKGEQTFTLCGTPEYLSPEIILNKGHSHAVDWWTLGILLYEMTVGIDPFSDEDPMNIYKKVVVGKVMYPGEIDKDAKDLIKNLLVSDLSKRFGCLKDGVNDIKNHKFFSKSNFNNILLKSVKPSYVPVLEKPDDTIYFNEYPEPTVKPPKVNPTNDPFLDW